jgi:Flp pilus assembly pilin Flp
MDTEATTGRTAGRLAEEDGAQAVEYAMIGGVGAGLIGLLWTLLQRTGLLDKVTATLVDAVVDLVKGWF